MTLTSLAQIKERWNEVLDGLLERDRVLWLAIFDARLAQYSDGILTLDFHDSSKFASEHDFSYIRSGAKLEQVAEIAQQILGTPITIVISERS